MRGKWNVESGQFVHVKESFLWTDSFANEPSLVDRCIYFRNWHDQQKQRKDSDIYFTQEVENLKDQNALCRPRQIKSQADSQQHLYIWLIRQFLWMSSTTIKDVQIWGSTL